ncbi:hypothetical protein [Amycolatopsis vancoresmycina]|uniref:Uncharacterized protein n=1 Tax=Amycolatopsis vancoresmycina DSM 44592 TaxID=1292037 RepID=R1FJF3_9PSEU|nr:hypothetical protein [Amycolatopsis vancoresmycina]EOD59687.1 hypothetical protein H480_41510 [Amycolatopsis vancoresmycina DSM 44592]
MTEYGRDRESRRRTRAVLGAGQLTASAALLSLKTGWIPATAEAPSSPVQLPVQAASLLGVEVPGRRARRADEVGTS